MAFNRFVQQSQAKVEATLRQTRRFVAVKTEDQQPRFILVRTQRIFVGQRTQMINALCGHLARHGLVAATGTEQLKRMADALEDRDKALPEAVRDLAQTYLVQIAELSARLEELHQKVTCAAKEANVARRLQSMPCLTPITALAMETFAPEQSCYRGGRVFAAWLGLVPKQHSTGGKARLGRTSKMGQRDIRTISAYVRALWSQILAALLSVIRTKGSVERSDCHLMGLVA